jgi:hypothetical protein
MKGKKRLDTSSGPLIPPVTYEGLSTPPSAPEVSRRDTQQLENHDFYDIPSPDTLQHQYSSLNDQCDMPLQPLTPQTPAPLPCTHMSAPGIGSCNFSTGGHQQPSHLSYSNCPPKAFQQQYQPANHSCFMIPHQYPRPYVASQITCACSSTPTPNAWYSQSDTEQQRMQGFYDTTLSHTAWTSPENYTRGSFEQTCGSPVFDLGSPFVIPSQPANTYMALPPPSKRACCCEHHNHGYSSRGPHPFQDAARGPMLLSYR